VTQAVRFTVISTPKTAASQAEERRRKEAEKKGPYGK